MIDKINSSQNNAHANNYNYKVNNKIAAETVSNTIKDNTPLKDNKSAKEIFDWLNIEELMKFANKKSESFQEKFLAENSLKKNAACTPEHIRQYKIEKEKEHIAKPISERTAYNTKQLKSAGVKDSDISKYLTYDGHVNNAGKKILNEHGKSYK